MVLLNKEKNNSGKSQERESLSSKWQKVTIQFVSGRYGSLSFRLGFDGRARTPSLIREIFPLPFPSILAELFFPRVICLLLTST